MTDKGESELRKWALDRPNGDPIKPQDIVKLVFAFDDDNTAKFEELKDALKRDLKRFADLEETVKLLGDRQTAWELECPQREAAQTMAHHEFHAEHLKTDHAVPPRRMDDPPDSEFLEHRESAHPGSDEDAITILELVRGWTLFKKILWVAASAAIVALVGFGISYYGSLWAADRVEKDFVHTEQTATPQPTVTVTVVPSPAP